MSLRGDQHHVSPFRSAPSPAMALIVPRTRAIEAINILISSSSLNEGTVPFLGFPARKVRHKTKYRLGPLFYRDPRLSFMGHEPCPIFRSPPPWRWRSLADRCAEHLAVRAGLVGRVATASTPKCAFKREHVSLLPPSWGRLMEHRDKTSSCRTTDGPVHPFVIDIPLRALSTRAVQLPRRTPIPDEG